MTELLGHDRQLDGPETESAVDLGHRQGRPVERRHPRPQVVDLLVRAFSLFDDAAGKLHGVLAV